MKLTPMQKFQALCALWERKRKLVEAGKLDPYQTSLVMDRIAKRAERILQKEGR